MWPDNETGVDLLGFDVHAELLAGLVTNPNVLPVTAGLFGDWGGGKSAVPGDVKLVVQYLASATAMPLDAIGNQINLNFKRLLKST